MENNAMKFLFSLLATTLTAISLLTGPVYAAAVFSPADQPLGYIGPVELANSDISSGTTAYRGWFENGSWQGDLIEYDVSSTGGMTTSIDLTSASPAQGASATNWSAHVQFAANEMTAGYWNSGRKIITHNGSSQVGFRWSKLSISQKQAIDLAAYNGSATSSNVLNFLRGDRSNEAPTGNLRLRFSILGDIIHSNPEYVGAPEAGLIESSYVSFTNSNANRAPRVYVGANDGMLHAFDALTGNEAWAYIPSMVIEKLYNLATTPYSHSYFVDGGITAQDAFFGGAWHTVLIGSLGAGGKGLYALDVTHPDLSSEYFSSGDDKKILWELDADADDDLGYIFDSSTVVKLNDGKWYAINGNGVSSVNGIAKLYLVNIQTGAVTKISTGSGSAGSPNGLSAPALVDTNNDGMADIAYAGDINGDLWKFDLTGSPSVAYKLYDGAGTQPITTSPEVTNHSQTGHLVLFGTGRLYTAADSTDTSVQALYGIWDTGSAPGGGDVRLTQTLSADTGYTSGSYSESVRTFTTTAAIDWATYKGWKVSLPAGERLITSPQLRAGRVKATITNPDGYENWLLEVTFDEGGVEDDTIFDLDRNGQLGTADRVDNNADNDLDDLEDIPMAWRRGNGNMSQVTIARVAQGFDTLFLNYLNPPLIPPACTGTCGGGGGGVYGGHIDVDTDRGGNNHGNETSGHVHQYDDVNGITYVDYFNINPVVPSDLEGVDEVGISSSERFIVLIANADISPGVDLTVGAKTWNVVVYQRMLHEQLRAWNPKNDPFLDDEGDPLSFTLSELEAAGGLRSTFNSLTLLSGGIHPTSDRCVNNDSAVTFDRWRNGALTMQLVKVQLFLDDPDKNPLELLDMQDPPDLRSPVMLPPPDGQQILIGDFNNNGEIKAGDPEYEHIGGILVKDQNEFLYESTMFWHIGDIAQLVMNDQPCYGEQEWADAVIAETQGVTEAEFAQMLAKEGFADLDAVAAELDTLECTAADKAQDNCSARYKKLSALQNLGFIVSDQVGTIKESLEGGATPPASGGSPYVIEGGISEGGVTSGPNFETGRRTWTDILP
jgi:hypothetical protein